MSIPFIPYPKTPRLKRNVVITEKLDGTNAQVHIRELTPDNCAVDDYDIQLTNDFVRLYAIRAGSRNRWVKPGKDTDNYGFAAWVQQNAEELLQLGEGHHFGEWWGQGIARNYGLAEKRFSLFNTLRWGPHNPNTPACCHVVPTLMQGDVADVDIALSMLRIGGSRAPPGFMKPEGVIVFHSAAKQNFKVLLENGEVPKGWTEALLSGDFSQVVA